MAFKFEKLRVWQDSVTLSSSIHETISNFPDREKYVLSSQIQRAADSISLNIAEGSTGQSNAEFKKFLGYSIRSGIEVVGCLYLAKGRNLLSQEQYLDLYNHLHFLCLD